MALATVTPIRTEGTQTSETSEALARSQIANEMIFAVVGPVGSGTSEIAEALSAILMEKGFDSHIIKARTIIEEWASRRGILKSHTDKLNLVKHLQDLGDNLRETSKDHAAVAHGLITRVRSKRAEKQGINISDSVAVIPDGARRAFILDAIRHPAEVRLLRTVYQNAFCLIAVVCDEDVRAKRLRLKFAESGDTQIAEFQKRDEHAPKKHGQRVAAAFQLADFFVDNTPERFLARPGGQKEENPNWDVVQQIERLTDLLTFTKIVRPTPAETAMFHAYGAKMQSSCLSRQVGAALIGQNGNLISTGTNEVPRAGGGLYGEDHKFDTKTFSRVDARCFVHNKYCSNTKEQNSIIQELFDEIDELKNIKLDNNMMSRIRGTRLGQLIEFSRAVHAEMDAIVSAARTGTPVVGGRLFVTTYPCHNCARHIVAAGIDEVQYIEPYLKSRALHLHSDSIMTDPKAWVPATQYGKTSDPHGKTPNVDNFRVLFRPFTGIAPRLYRRAFLKDRDLKDDMSGDLLTTFGDPDSTSLVEPLRHSYAEMEAKLASKDERASP